MTKATIDDLKSWIDEIMRKKGIKHYELRISGNGMKGDGYMGEITFVTVQTGQNGLTRNYNFLIKSAKKSDKLRETTPVKGYYLREIYMYATVLPVLLQFQIENSTQEPFAKHAKFYKVCEEPKKEALILENLKLQGFELHDRTVPMNLSHIEFVFTQYARFHAISMAMKQIKPELFRSITKNMEHDVFVDFVIQTNFVPAFAAYFRKSLRVLKAKEAKKFDGYESEIEEIFTKTTYDKEDPITVIVHGDCWNNNLMFRYDQNNKTRPIDMRFIDFQLAKVAHPILDLSYFLYSCCDKEILKNFDSLLKLYHSTLSGSLSQYGIDVNKFFPLNKLKEDWKTVGKYGLYMGLTIIQFALYDSKEAPDFEEMAENNKVVVDSLITMIKDDKRFDDRAGAILGHFSKTFL